MRFFLICVGGAVGTGARYLIATAFPFGTLIVNIAGSFLIALVMQTMPPNDLRFMLVTGVLGGFTTYSAFNYETTTYLREGAWLAGSAYLGGMLAACLAAGLLGLAAGRLLTR